MTLSDFTVGFAGSHRRETAFRVAFTCFLLLPSSRLASQVVISEIQALNRSTIVDEDGQSSDWLELLNTGSSAVDLGGWHLSDTPGTLDQWTFPPLELGPGEFLVVFA